ncbi:helix-turn-helix domain-containing protein, partial [Escherichia coli]|nr:helix-turn-helix domain-containing protein [Escherichia coli]
TKNWLPTQPEFGYLPNQKLVTCNTEYKDKNINTKRERLKESFEEESLKKRASFCDSHECDIKEDDFLSLDELNDFLSMDESDLEVSSKSASKTSDLEEDKISDVNVDSDHKNTQCPATDDELPDVDLDDEEDPEEELKREQRKAEIKERFRKAKLKNRVDELDDFDDSDDDDFSFTPRKKTHSEPKKGKGKVRRIYAGGMR